MNRRYVNEFGHQETIDQVFVAADKQFRPNRNGNLYLQVDLSDRSGSIGARMWNASESVYKAVRERRLRARRGDHATLPGGRATDRHADDQGRSRRGQRPMIFPRCRRRGRQAGLATGRDPSQYDRTVPAHRGRMFPLGRRIHGQVHPGPAGIKNHHAYQGGLLEHVVSLMEVVLRISPCYPQIDRNLLLMGAFLHDLGKIDELRYERELSYSDEGQLIGHLVMAVSMLEKKIAEAENLSGEPFPEETALRLKHMIVSHHGEYDYGSPKLPMTLEAVALYCLDNLDAKVNSFQQLLRDDPNLDSSWTAIIPIWSVSCSREKRRSRKQKRD